jgi:hypothetical protein
MTLSDKDRGRILDVLDTMDEAAAHLAVATLEAFGRWLADVLPGIFRRIREELRRIWASVKAVFA